MTQCGAAAPDQRADPEQANGKGEKIGKASAACIADPVDGGD